MAQPGDSSNSIINSSNGNYFFENSLAGTLSGTLPGTLSATLPASLSSTPVLGDYSFSGASAILGSSLQSIAIDLPLQQQIGNFDLISTARFDQQQQQQQYHVQDGQLQHLGHTQLLDTNGINQQQNSQNYVQVQQYQLQMQVEHQHQQQHQQQAQQQPRPYQPQYQVQPPQISQQEPYQQARQPRQQPQQPQQHQRYHQHHRHSSSDSRKQRQLQQATTRHKQKYLAALQKTSSPSQPRSHPTELVRRATTAHPAPACPSSMSSHPDHSMFPSYTFLEPNFITEASHKRQLERSRTQAIMSLSGSQPSSNIGLSPASQSMYSPASSLQSPRTPQTPQTPQAFQTFQTFQTSQALQIPQFSQPQPGPGQHTQLGSFSQSMRKRQRSPPDHPAKRVRIAHTPGHLLDISDTGTPLEFKGNHLRVPSPPNPHTNYFPLLGPATPTQKRSSTKGKSVASNNNQARPSPSLHDAEMDSIITYKLEMLNRSNDTELMAGMSTPVAENIQAAISSVYVFLPYGHAAPVVRLLNQESFASVIQDLLSTAGKQAGNLRASEGMPAWQKSFLQKTASLRPQPQSFSSFQSMPPSQLSPKLPDARLLMNCVKMFSEHIETTYPVIPRVRLRNIVPRTLQHYGPESQNQSQSPMDPLARLNLAIDLLVLALGSLCWARLDGTAFEPGPGFFVEAKSILGALTKQTLDNIENIESMDTIGGGASAGSKGKGRAGVHNAYTHDYNEYNQNAENIAPEFSGLAPSLDLARAYLLAAMFCGQMAYLQEAAEYVEAANVVIRYMLFQSAMVGEYELVSLVEQSHKPHPLSSRERQLVVLYWTCVQLELEICSEVGQTPSSLLRYQSLVPIPESDMYWPPSGESMQRGDFNDAPQLDLGNLAPITMQVRLWRQLNTIYEEEFVHKKPASVIKEAVTKMKHQFEASTSPCPSSPTTPDKSLMAARARTLYCEGRSYGVLNSLQSHLKVDVSEMAEVMLCLVDTIHAYHDLADDGRILSNSFGVAMIQCRYLLVLFAASRTIPAAAAVVSDDLISGLITGTLDSLPQTAGPSGTMEAARRVLHAMQTMLNQPQADSQQTQKSQSQSQAQVPTTAGLSLYCPPFSTWPEILTAVPTATTATTASSYFQTPNTPHHMASPAYNANSNSPFGSPVSPATTCSPSPSSATYAPARRLFGGEKLVAFNSNASFMSTDSGYASQPLAASFPAPAPPVAPVFDMAAFARHLGLVRR